MKKHLLPLAAILFLSILVVSSCVKKQFDNPPDSSTIDPNLPVNGTIWQIKSLYQGLPVEITDDITISGIVNADDRTGGLYKQIIVQDSTSGIAVLLGSTGLYNDYPIGRKIYIKCKGLYLGSYNGFVQLGAKPELAVSTDLTDIPANAFSQHIVKASYPHEIAPRVISLDQIKGANTTNLPWIGTLIQIDSVEFKSAFVGINYAYPSTVSSGTDLEIEDCATGTGLIRTSAYANYRAALTPSGKGSLKSVLSIYSGKYQLLIRDTTDVQFNGTRCGGVVIGPPANISIDSLRKMYMDTSSTQKIVLGNQIIHGTVISSYADSNISQASSSYIQDESGRGINIFGISGLQLGDSITVKCTGNELIVYNGALELKKGSGATLTATIISKNKSVSPTLVTIADLNADLNNPVFNQRKYESTLVKVVNATISGSPAFYAGNKTATDATGSIILYSRTAVPYSTTALPVGTVSITAIALKYKTTPELTIRKLSDVQ
jgi:hypothetical protein